MIIQPGKTNWILIAVVALVAGAAGGGLVMHINEMIRQTTTLSQITELKKPKKTNETIDSGNGNLSLSASQEISNSLNGIAVAPSSTAASPNNPTVPATVSSGEMAGWATYTNYQFDFQLDYPSGVQIKKSDMDDSHFQLVFPLKVAGFDFRFPKVGMSVVKEVVGYWDCPAPKDDDPFSSIYGVNGINFVKTNLGNAYPDSYDVDYCVVHNGYVYLFGLRDELTGTIDDNLANEKFDQVMQALKFRFTNAIETYQ